MRPSSACEGEGLLARGGGEGVGGRGGGKHQGYGGSPTRSNPCYASAAEIVELTQRVLQVEKRKGEGEGDRVVESADYRDWGGSGERAKGLGFEGAGGGEWMELEEQAEKWSWGEGRMDGLGG